MKNKVRAYERTTLLLDASWMPVGVLTARASFKALINNKVKALDMNKNSFDFEEWVASENASVQFHVDQPTIASASVEWKLPTIVIDAARDVGRENNRRRTRELGFKDLAILYDNTCQICLVKKERRELNIDHVLPKSLQGTNFTSNLTLACRKCNSKKDSTYPYFNANGDMLKGTVIPNNFILIEDHDMRSEWIDFIFHKQ